jgi:exopolyphosphatase/guanosine-5'-triphosphate,3'-diphosphate pyrophosphatase
LRVAAIDIGTNTVLLLIAERVATGELVAVEERATITRLGQGVDRTRVLAPEAILRTMACLSDYAAAVQAAEVKRVAVVATSAMRDAAGGEALRQHVRSLFRVDLDIISGDEEARLTFAGALSGLGYDERSGEVVVFDVGGGSTEVVIGRVAAGGHGEELRFARSFDIGSVRLTERYVRSDPPQARELEAIQGDARTTLRDVPLSEGGAMPVGIAGTVTTLAAVSLGLATYDAGKVHGLTLDGVRLGQVVQRLSALRLDDRRQIPGLEPKRADVIVAGGLIVEAVLVALQAERMRVSDRGVRWGLAQRLAEP